MHNLLHHNHTLSVTKTEDLAVSGKEDAGIWQEYSMLHDSFVETLSYENNRKNSSGVWQLNYI